MINNPIPLVRVTSVTTASTVTDFATTYTHPITGKFYLEFDEAFLSSYNTSTFTRSTDTAIPMLTRTGGNVHTDMISQAITLKKLGLLPMSCNPYRFRMIRLYDPDRVIFAECLPVSQTTTSTTTTTTNTSSESTPAVASDTTTSNTVVPDVSTTTDLAELTF